METKTGHSHMDTATESTDLIPEEAAAVAGGEGALEVPHAVCNKNRCAEDTEVKGQKNKETDVQAADGGAEVNAQRHVEKSAASASKAACEGHQQVEPPSDRPHFPHRPGIKWCAGAKLEAKDFMGKWYPAKLVEVDDSDNTVLIHFDGWNQRYDEWLDMDSERIRPMTRHSERRERREKTKAVVKPPTEHKLGENVFAKWTDCRMYPATIVGVNTTGTYDVVFYDGFKKTVQAMNVRHMPEDVQVQYAESGLLPELGKNMKQKVRELIQSVQATPEPTPSSTKRRLSCGSTSTKDAVKSDSKPSSKGGDSKPSSKDTSPTDKTSGSGSRANVKNVPSSKKRLLSSEALPAKKLKMSPSSSSGGSTKVKIKQSAPAKQKTKDSLKSSATKATCLVSSEGAVEEVALTEVPGSKETEISLQLPTGEDKQQTGQGDEGNGDSCLAQTSDSGEKGTARKEFKVDGGDLYPYHCQFKGCDKGFRKESLLQYHMKYYHTPDGGVVAVPPVRKRKKTTSVCSTDSEVSVLPPGGQKPAKRKRDCSQASSSVSSLPDTPVEPTADQSLDNSEVDSKTTTTEEGEAQDTLGEELLEREAEEEEEEEGIDELSVDDVVNCICQINEESGLMIQCEVCLCWQHALCMEITAETLPSKYICYVCVNPPGVRDGARFVYDQDWLKEGTLARFGFLPDEPNDQKKCQIMQATHELVTDMHGISRALNSTKRKLHVLKHRSKYEMELRVWKTDWDAEEQRQQQQKLGQQQLLKEKEEKGKQREASSERSETDIQVQAQIAERKVESESGTASSATKQGFPSTDVTTQGTASTDAIQEGTPPTDTSKQETPSTDTTKQESQPPGATKQESPSADATEQGTLLTDATTEPAVEQTADCSKDNKNGSKPTTGDVNPSAETSSDSKVSVSAGNMPKPSTSASVASGAEKAVESHSEGQEEVLTRCEGNLRSHINIMHNSIEEQLDMIEGQVSALESAEDTSGRSGDILRDLPRVKKAVHQMIWDLSKVRRMALFH